MLKTSHLDFFFNCYSKMTDVIQDMKINGVSEICKHYLRIYESKEH